MTRRFVFGAALVACLASLTTVDVQAFAGPLERPVATNASADAVGSALWWNSANEVRVAGPDTVNRVGVSMTATDATVLPSRTDPTSFTVAPSLKRVTLSLAAPGKTPTSVEFGVIKPPAPELQVWVNGSEHDGTTLISKNATVMVRVAPDSDFLANHPMDARYMIDQIDVLVQRSLGPPTKIGTVSASGKNAASGISVPLAGALTQDPPGATVYLRVKKLFRINFQNKKIEVALSDRQRALNLVIH